MAAATLEIAGVCGGWPQARMSIAEAQSQVGSYVPRRFGEIRRRLAHRRRPFWPEIDPQSAPDYIKVVHR
jgi:hypothetical protein